MWKVCSFCWRDVHLRYTWTTLQNTSCRYKKLGAVIFSLFSSHTLQLILCFVLYLAVTLVCLITHPFLSDFSQTCISVCTPYPLQVKKFQAKANTLTYLRVNFTQQVESSHNPCPFQFFCKKLKTHMPDLCISLWQKFKENLTMESFRTKLQVFH